MFPGGLLVYESSIDIAVSLVTTMAPVADVAQVLSLAPKLSHAMGMNKKFYIIKIQVIYIIPKKNILGYI